MSFQGTDWEYSSPDSEFHNLVRAASTSGPGCRLACEGCSFGYEEMCNLFNHRFGVNESWVSDRAPTAVLLRCSPTSRSVTFVTSRLTLPTRPLFGPRRLGHFFLKKIYLIKISEKWRSIGDPPFSLNFFPQNDSEWLEMDSKHDFKNVTFWAARPLPPSFPPLIIHMYW